MSPKADSAFRVRELRLMTARIEPLPRPVKYALVMAELNARIVMALAKHPPAVVHCHDTMVLPAGAFAQIALGSTLIYDAHELESDKNGQTGALSAATLWIEKGVWPLLDALISVSPSILVWYERHLGPKPALCLLNSSEISTRTSRTSRTRIKASIGLTPDVPLYLYVGEFAPGRGIELLLDAFARTDESVHVAFIGSGALRDDIRRFADSTENIHVLDPVPHDELVDFIQDADAGFCLIEDVSLSDRYCLPNKLFEYAFADLPVIASTLPDMSQYVSSFNLGVCVETDEASILAELKQGPPSVPTSVDRLKPLSWQVQAGNLIEFYRQVLARRQANRRKPRRRLTARRRRPAL